MNFLLQIHPVSGRPLDELVEPQITPHYFFESFTETDYLLYPGIILLLGLMAFLAFRKRIKEPEKVLFRLGVFIFLVGILRTALFAHGIATFEAWGISTPSHPSAFVDEGIEILCMYTGLSLIPIGASLLPLKSQPVAVVNASAAAGKPESHLHD